MKKKLTLLILALTVSLLALVACGDNGGSENNDPPPPEGTLIYETGTTLKIIRSESDKFSDVSALSAAITKATGRNANTYFDAGQPSSGEIVVGDTTRDITGYAKEYAESLDLISNDISVWVIYSYGGSVAIWWSHPAEALADTAINYLIDNYFTDESLYLKDGPIHHDTFDRRAYEDAREAAKREAELAEIEAILGKDARDAIEDYLRIFTDKYYVWLANLYDPGIGAFYYSNSGRDNEGFLPDIESTVQALNWIAGNGMLENYGGSLKEALPDWMREQILEFAIGLQSSDDGYFYHPQWGANISTSRRGRDLGWATQIIVKLGGEILYDTPNGYKGVLGAPGASAQSALTDRLGGSAAVAVSNVVPTASLPSYLRDTEEFRKYLEKFNWAENSYSAGNTMSSEAGQIKTAGPEFIAVFQEVLDKHQEIAQEKLRDAAEAEARAKNPNITAEEIDEVRKNAQNGLWEDRISFDSVNGLMKISSAYNSLGIKLNYAEEAIESAMQMVYFEGTDVEGRSPVNSVDVYNPWVSLNQVQSNIRKHYSADFANSIKAKVTENAADMIRITMKKVSVFAKSDGSYGYNVKQVPAKSQGAPVAVDGTNEGDINGGNIATNGTFSSMCSALGISKPSLYFNSDWEIFISIIEGLEPVKKVEIVLETEPVTFDDESAGEESPSRVTGSMGTGYIKVVNDPRDGASGNVLEYVTYDGQGSTMTTSIIGSGTGNCFVLEWDMNIKQSNKNTVSFQIRLGEAFMFTVKTAANGYQLGDSSSTNGTTSVVNWFEPVYEYDTWHKIRIEYYYGSTEDVKTLIFVDGNQIAESDNYYGKPKPDAVSSKVPSNDYRIARFFALKSSDMTVYFDNIVAERITKTLPTANTDTAE